MPALLAWVVLPRFLLMLRGIPAIELTDDYLINNISGFSIEWADISEIHIKNNMKGPNALVINLKHPEKYFDTPLKKLGYQLKQLFTADDITIPLIFVSGDSNTLFQAINGYRARHDKI
jgi:hypothetical protein